MVNSDMRGGNPLSSATILVVDDHAINLKLLCDVLKRAGCPNVIQAADGAEALEIMENVIPDCLVLDAIMPGVDGFEVCRKARQDDRLAGMPIIFQTALTETRDRWRAFDAGASDIISKPLETRELVARVKVHVANNLMSRELLTSNRRMEGELMEASRLIEAIMPQPQVLRALEADGLKFDWFIRPCSTIGGDMWSIIPLPDGRVTMVIADVAGHGIAAALRAFSLSSLLIPAPPFAGDAIAVGRHLDNRLKAVESDLPSFIAALIAVLDRKSGRLDYVAGGMRDAVILRASGGVETLTMSGLPFGLMQDAPRVERSTSVSEGDLLIFYSDALIEHFFDDRSETQIQEWIVEQARGCDPSIPVSQHIGNKYIEHAEYFGDDLLIVALRIQ